MSPTPSSSDQQHAPLLRRLAAILYDTLLLIASYFMIAAVMLGITTVLYGAPATHEISEPILPAATLQKTLFPFCLLFTIGFFSYFWTKHGRTLGMQTWRLSIQTSDGHPPSLKQCLIRLAVAPLSFLAAGVGMLWMLWDKQHRTWQDCASNTRTCYQPKNGQSKKGHTKKPK